MVKPQQPDVTIIAHLLDHNPATGRAHFVTHAPYTFNAEQAG